MATPHPIAVVEACYRLAGDEHDWLKGLAEAARPALDAGLGIIAYTYDLRADGPLHVSPPAIAGSDPRFCEAVLETDRRMPELDRRRAYALGPAAVTSSMLFTPGTEAATYEPVADAAAALGFRDFLGVNAGNPDGSGVLLGAPLDRVQRVRSSTAARWGRVAAHVATALRLRRALARAKSEPPVWLSPRGRVLHVEAGQASPTALDALRAATVALDTARGSMARREPDDALAIWRALVEGRWSLVDHVDTDGKRFVLARPNPPFVKDPRGLSPLEHAVATYAARGFTNKLIAYTLGVHEGTIASALARALRKLDAPHRAALQALIAAKPTMLGTVKVGDDVLTALVVPSVRPRGLRGLTPRERAVAEGVARGESNRDIATRLGRSERTIANQLASIYRKLGVASRSELRARWLRR
jgi:DNA-binding NarL/FixJ family response regulator